MSSGFIQRTSEDNAFVFGPLMTALGLLFWFIFIVIAAAAVIVVAVAVGIYRLFEWIFTDEKVE